jgi:prepilin-type N-terminal cleavage/methylation domain-containing protein
MNNRSPGFTLTETLVVVLVGALVMGSIYQMVIMQDRTTRDQYARIENTQNGRVSLAVITNDLKEISAVDGDIVAAAPTDITFRALRKAAFICAKPNNTTIEVWELGEQFRIADNLLVFSEGNVNSTGDDQWVATTVTGVGAATDNNCTGPDPYGVTGNKTKRLTVSVALPNANPGSPVRSFVVTRYRLTDSGEWGQLMRTDTLAEMPIIDRLALNADQGLQFRYFNAAGSQIASGSLATNLNNIMRIQVKVRGKAASSVSRTGANRFQDSLVTNVYLRGNHRTQ